MPDLWMAISRKRPTNAIPRDGYEMLPAALLDPDTSLLIAPVDDAVWRHFETLPSTIADPMDGLIVATARAHDVPLITKDSRIASAEVVKVIWWHLLIIERSACF